MQQLFQQAGTGDGYDPYFGAFGGGCAGWRGLDDASDPDLDMEDAEDARPNELVGQGGWPTGQPERA